MLHQRQLSFFYWVLFFALAAIKLFTLESWFGGFIAEAAYCLFSGAGENNDIDK